MSAETSDAFPNRIAVASGAGAPPLVLNRQEDGTLVFEPLFQGAVLTADDFQALAKFGLGKWVEPPTPDTGGE